MSTHHQETFYASQHMNHEAYAAALSKEESQYCPGPSEFYAAFDSFTSLPAPSTSNEVDIDAFLSPDMTYGLGLTFNGEGFLTSSSVDVKDADLLQQQQQEHSHDQMQQLLMQSQYFESLSNMHARRFSTCSTMSMATLAETEGYLNSPYQTMSPQVRSIHTHATHPVEPFFFTSASTCVSPSVPSYLSPTIPTTHWPLADFELPPSVAVVDPTTVASPSFKSASPISPATSEYKKKSSKKASNKRVRQLSDESSEDEYKQEDAFSDATDADFSPIPSTFKAPIRRHSTATLTPNQPSPPKRGRFNSNPSPPSASFPAAPTTTTQQAQLAATAQTSLTGPNGTKVFHCPYPNCNKTFPRQYNLKSHMFCHSGLRPHTCNLCEAAFARKHDLQRHVRTLHATDRPFKCGNCSLSFMQVEQLKRHQVQEKAGMLASGSLVSRNGSMSVSDDE
ncbi:hypothetical protein HDU99_007215 [Rhizoclosmatium hyalinum]|nr:hypothetical protein HDU99_007215 [Rhizoclosmatium hyalinum]